jgi:hypothetical protein
VRTVTIKRDYSQNEEQIILQNILIKIQFAYPLTQFYIEFGAHDGISNSNLRFLAENGHPGIFLEGNKKLFKKLKINVKDLPILCILKMLDTQNNNLEKVLKQSNI